MIDVVDQVVGDVKISDVDVRPVLSEAGDLVVVEEKDQVITITQVRKIVREIFQTSAGTVDSDLIHDEIVRTVAGIWTNIEICHAIVIR